MSVAPSTIVNLLNVPLQANQKNQIDFANVAAQITYFNSRIVKIANSFTYQRKENIIRVPFNADTIQNVNYVMYDNVNYKNKWFYAFVERIEYINDSCTHLHIKTDVWQTWQFELIFKQSFIAREHVADDTEFKHTLPENVYSGEPKIFDIRKATDENFSARNQTEFEDNYYVAILTIDPLTSFPARNTGLTLSGNAKACYTYCTDITDVKGVLTKITDDGQADKILALYPIHKNLVNIENVPNQTGYNMYWFSDAYQSIIKQHFFSRNKMLSGYSVKNKKCLCYPFNYFVLQNNNGSKAVLKIEDFWNVKEGLQDYIILNAHYSCALPPSLIVVPANYNRAENSLLSGENFDYSIEYNDFPQIAYSYGIFTQYCARNSSSLEFQKYNYLVNTFTNPLTLMKKELTSDLLLQGENNFQEMQSFEYMAQMSDKAKQGSSFHGKPSGNMQFFSGSAGVYLMCYSLDYEDLQIVDSYFTMFGYNVSVVKDVNFKSRKNHNYIETKDINLTGNLPQEDLLELQRIFNRGVTFWHNPQTFGDYSQDNSPI